MINKSHLLPYCDQSDQGEKIPPPSDPYIQGNNQPNQQGGLHPTRSRRSNRSLFRIIL